MGIAACAPWCPFELMPLMRRASAMHGVLKLDHDFGTDDVETQHCRQRLLSHTHAQPLYQAPLFSFRAIGRLLDIFLIRTRTHQETSTEAKRQAHSSHMAALDQPVNLASGLGARPLGASIVLAPVPSPRVPWEPIHPS